MASSIVPKWQELPFEILALIFPYLKPSQHDLFAAFLVCRNWYSFAVGNLWHTPQFNSVDSFNAFEKCLRAQPDACHVVREFHLKQYKGHLFPYSSIQQIVSQLPALTSIQLPLFNRVDGAGPSAECLFALTQSKPYLRRLHFSCEENNTQIIVAPETSSPS
ncbi:hypothetical protein K7432_014025 [Basidiobolus ranarum]|uniref:F-box domain-containing protein n=1 Tax=Basidiobolus ranarum TaxID=34480 RepID=A0ABR2WI94_9FUNG